MQLVCVAGEKNTPWLSKEFVLKQTKNFLASNLSCQKWQSWKCFWSNLSSSPRQASIWKISAVLKGFLSLQLQNNSMNRTWGSLLCSLWLKGSSPNLGSYYCVTEGSSEDPTVMTEVMALVAPMLFIKEQWDEKPWHLVEDLTGSFWKRSWKPQPEPVSCNTQRNFRNTMSCSSWLFSDLCWCFEKVNLTTTQKPLSLLLADGGELFFIMLGKKKSPTLITWW